MHAMGFRFYSRAGADWAARLHVTCQMGRLVRRPGGPLRQMLKYRSNELPR